jgi:hypothetical protein
MRNDGQKSHLGLIRRETSGVRTLSRRGFPAAALVVTWLLVFLGLAPQLAWSALSSKDFQLFRDPAGRFSLDFPKDWQVNAGVGDLLVTFAQKKNEAALVIERFHLNLAPTADKIDDLFAQIEEDTLKERQPQASDVSHKIVDGNGRRFIVIDYTRPGLTRPVERARQYSLPFGQDLYRLICSAAPNQFAKYDPLFAHASDSFTAPAADVPGKPPGAGAVQTKSK